MVNLGSLARNQIGAAGMQALASAFAGGALRKLGRSRLDGNKIGDAGVVALAAHSRRARCRSSRYCRWKGSETKASRR